MRRQCNQHRAVEALLKDGAAADAAACRRSGFWRGASAARGYLCVPLLLLLLSRGTSKRGPAFKRAACRLYRRLGREQHVVHAAH